MRAICELTYQYSSFGVPGLGLKRGLSDDLVIAPYATALAAMIDPDAAAANFARLAEVGAQRPLWLLRGARLHRPRVPEDAAVAIVRAYMAHHQGMMLVALANVLHDGAMRARFHAEPIVQATELLLQERMPRDVVVARPRAEEVRAPAHVREFVPPVLRQFTSPHDPTPGRTCSRTGGIGDADDRGLRLQPLARPRGHPMAGRRHPRSLGHLRLPARHPQRRGLVGRVSAQRRRAGQL